MSNGLKKQSFYFQIRDQKPSDGRELSSENYYPEEIEEIVPEEPISRPSETRPPRTFRKFKSSPPPENEATGNFMEETSHFEEPSSHYSQYVQENAPYSKSSSLEASYSEKSISRMENRDFDSPESKFSFSQTREPHSSYVPLESRMRAFQEENRLPATEKSRKQLVYQEESPLAEESKRHSGAPEDPTKGFGSYYRKEKLKSPSLKPSFKEEDGCYLCEWKRYVTFAGKEFAEVQKCQCSSMTCQKCFGEGGYEISLDTGSTAWKICECEKLSKRIDLYKSARIPARFATKTLDAFAPSDPSQAKAREFLYQFLLDPKNNQKFTTGQRGILLMGPTGVGKTHLMVALLRTLVLDFGVHCRFVDFGQLLSELRDSYSRGLSELDVLNQYTSTDVLLIDDLGKGRNTKWELGVIDVLLSQRYNSNKTTLITTNYTDKVETTLRERSRSKKNNDSEEQLIRDTLYDRVGDRIYSRLQEMSFFFYMKGLDYRLQKKNF